MPVASVREIFEQYLPEKLKARPDVAAKVGAVFQFNVSGPNGGSWFVDLQVAGGAVGAGTAPAPQCTVAIKDDDFVALVNKNLSPQMAFMTGKIKIQGDYGLAMKLQQVL